MRIKSMSARARLKMRMLVVFLKCLFVTTVNITKRLPMKPIMMMTMKNGGTSNLTHVSSMWGVELVVVLKGRERLEKSGWVEGWVDEVLYGMFWR